MEPGLPRGSMGANSGSQYARIGSDPPRRPQNITAGEKLPIRRRRTGPDTGTVPGGQGVVGSNPAVPTGRRDFSNILMPPPEPAKEPFHPEMTLPEAHAHHVPRPPTRAFVNTAEPAKPGSQGVKDRRATRTLHSDPGSCEPPDTIPSAPAHRKPDAHRAAEAMGRGQAGTHTPGLPRHLRRDAYWHEISPRTNRHDSCQRHSKRLAVMKCAYRIGAARSYADGADARARIKASYGRPLPSGDRGWFGHRALRGRCPGARRGRPSPRSCAAQPARACYPTVFSCSGSSRRGCP